MKATARRARLWLGLLAMLYAAVLLAGVIAPYAPDAQNRTLPFAPPTRLHFIEPTGRIHLRSFVYPLAGRAWGCSAARAVEAIPSAQTSRSQVAAAPSAKRTSTWSPCWAKPRISWPRW